MLGRKAITVAVVALVAGGAAPALGFDPATTIDTFADWTDNPVRDVGDFETGQYQFMTMIVGGITRGASSVPHLVDPEAGKGDAAHELQGLFDDALHNRPTLPENQVMDVGHPALEPDFNGNGVYGEPADYDFDVDARRDVAPFRIMEPTPEGGFAPVDRDGDGVDDTGVVIETAFVNSRGLVLDATLWLPGTLVPDGADTETDEAVVAGDLASTPGMVFANGFSSRQEHYYYLAHRMVADGYAVLTFDPAGQGESEGTWFDEFQPSESSCVFASCLDVQDAMRWFTGETVVAAPELQGYSGNQVRPFSPPATPDQIESAANRNPMAPLLDVDEIALSGNSMGALSTVEYLRLLGEGADLPNLAAAVVLSGSGTTHFSVPVQLQTSDFDGSPTLVGPQVAGVGLAFGGQGGIGYQPMKAMYDEQLARRHENMSMVVIKGGVHTDHTDQGFIPRTLWGDWLAASYAADWINCHALGDGVVGVGATDPSCVAATQPRDHLSEAFDSEYASAGDGSSEAGPISWCIQAATQASLNHTPEQLVDQALGGPAPTTCTPTS